ncbi:quinoprotein relay system zinc metallohydrolase 2 [Arenibacterium sp. CAU 1754]
MSPIFEIIASLCLGAVCADRVLPTPMVMDEPTCEARAEQVVAEWLTTHPGLTAQGQSCQRIETLSDRAAEVQSIGPGQFVHFGQVEDVVPGTQGDVANTGFIIGTDAVAVIDAGTTRAVAEALYLAVRQQTDLPIRWVMITHMHPDHVLGAEVFREAGAEVIGSVRLRLALANRAESYMGNMERLLGPEVMLGTQVVLPDDGVDGTRDINLGGRVLTLQTYPTAHTTNDMSVLDRSSDTLWMGDLAFLEHTPALDGSINGWIGVLEGLIETKVQQIVPGHGRMVAMHPDGLRPTLAYLRALRAETRAALAAGESLQTALKHLGMDLGDQWQLFEQFNPRNATNAYVELEWE